jgi:hypothetical protein
VIDLQALLEFNAETFVVNLVLRIMEELLHSIYPLKSEQEIHSLLCPLIEEFLGIQLPNAYKNFRVDK